MVSTAMLSLKKLTNTSKTNNLPNNLSEIASNFSIMQTVRPRLRKAGRGDVECLSLRLLFGYRFETINNALSPFFVNSC